MSTPELLRLLLIIDLLSMLLLAVFYLRRRRLTLAGYCAWGLLALLLPVLGPFLVVALRPGKERK